jgi:hypothetical protein
MIVYICNCQKDFKNKYLAKHYSLSSDKEEIFDLIVRLMYNSKNCLYCYKKNRRSNRITFTSSYKKSIIKFFDSWMSKSYSASSNLTQAKDKDKYLYNLDK